MTAFLAFFGLFSLLVALAAAAWLGACSVDRGRR